MHSITTQPHRSAATREARWQDAVPSARCLAAATMALLVVFPLLLSAADHHAAERIPSHQHTVPFGEPAPAHGHEFAVAHEHAGPATPAFLTAPVVVSQSVAVAVMSLVQNLALPVLLLIVLCNLEPRTRRTPDDVLNDQVRIAPPTLPPALPARI